MVLAWLIAKSLWVKLPPLEGRELARDRAPRLDARVEQIRNALDAPRVAQILLTSDFNASVTQIPRLGIFGWPRTYLTLGVPLMCALQPAQFDAVLAHEFAHLSKSHPKLGLWVFRMSRTWQQLLSHLEQAHSWGGRLFESFFKWYVPRLHAHGLVMSRQDEYEADAEAAQVTGSAMREALLALELRGRLFNEHFWRDLWRRAELEKEPPAQTLSRLPASLRGELPRDEAEAWIGKALVRRALKDDTHPALVDRLAALGASREQSSTANDPLTQALGTTAADHFLGKVGDETLTHFDKEWHALLDEDWRERHKEIQLRRARVAELIARDQEGLALEGAEICELACSIADLESTRDAIPYLRRSVEAMPQHAGVQFMLGSALLAEHDASGVEPLKKALELAPVLAGEGNELLLQYYASLGDSPGIDAARRNQYEHMTLMRAVSDERGDVVRGDELVTAELTPEDREALRHTAEADDRIARMWIARKVTSHLPDRPMFVVLVEPRWWSTGMLARNSQTLAQDVLNRMQLPVAADALVIIRNSRVNWLERRMKKLEGARIFAR